MLNPCVLQVLWSIKRKSTERTTPGAGRPGSRWRSQSLFQEGCGRKNPHQEEKEKRKTKDTEKDKSGQKPEDRSALRYTWLSGGSNVRKVGLCFDIWGSVHFPALLFSVCAQTVILPLSRTQKWAAVLPRCTKSISVWIWFIEPDTAQQHHHQIIWIPVDSSFTFKTLFFRQAPSYCCTSVSLFFSLFFLWTYATFCIVFVSFCF